MNVTSFDSFAERVLVTSTVAFAFNAGNGLKKQTVDKTIKAHKNTLNAFAVLLCVFDIAIPPVGSAAADGKNSVVPHFVF